MTVPGEAGQRIRIYDLATGELQQLLAGHTGKIVALAFASDGTRLLSGSQDRTAILWDVAGARPPHRFDRHKAEVYAVGFTPDGDRVVTASFDRSLRLWRVADGGQIAEMRGHGEKIYALAVSPRDGSIASGSFDGEIRHWDGHTGRLLRPLANQDGAQVGSLNFSPDGRSLLSTCGGGHSCAGKPQVIWDVGTGRAIQTYAKHDNVALAAAVSPDGRLVATAGGDHNEIHIWDARTGATRQVLRGTGAPMWSAGFATAGDRLAWGQTCTGSPGADKIVGWQINKGPSQAADHVGAEQLRQHLHRPDIVERAILLGSAEQAVREAPGSPLRLTDLLARPVPRFRILAPRPGATARGGRSTVKIAIEATPDPVRSIRVQVNGRQVEERTPDIGSGGFGPGEHSLDVPLAGRRNDVRIVLTNAIGEKTEALTLMHEGEGALDRRGTLHILAIGVDKYPGLGSSCGKSGQEPCDLNYAGADARLLVQAIERRLGPGHTKVIKRVLVNGADDSNDLPTAANILDAFARLRQAAENDTVVASISGHGINDGPNYRFLATNAE